MLINVLHLKNLVSMYPYTEDSLENKENIENIILVYADINIYVMNYIRWLLGKENGR